MAQRAGAKAQGDWEGCHSTCWDANAPSDAGDRQKSNQFTKSGYPLGIMVNAAGDRFVDEGEDFRNYTYAKFGREIMRQNGGYVFQIYDSKVVRWLRKEEYGDDIVEKIWGKDIDELAERLVEKGLKDKKRFVNTIHEFNTAVNAFRIQHPKTTWDPSIKDGLSTESLPLSKSNWALALDEGPFLAIKVATGITFTFGGLAIDSKTAGVVSEATEKPIEGLFCAGEMVGGLFYG
jgi:succinate dehydrogenase/fumarate reductase flavoprotein subunit